MLTLAILAGSISVDAKTKSRKKTSTRTTSAVTPAIDLSDPWIDYKETDRNPIVERLSIDEIEECKTPASVAYNFVLAILDGDFDKMSTLGTSRLKSDFQKALKTQYKNDKTKMLEDNFSEGKLGIYSWMPALSDGHEVTVAFIQDESTYYDSPYWSYNPGQTLKNGKIYLPGETSPRKTQITKKIYITCSPSAEIGTSGFQDISRYGDTNVKVLVNYENGAWRVDGFK